MDHDFSEPPDATSAVQQAKAHLRKTRHCTVGGSDLPLASMVTGAPLVYLETVPEDDVDVVIGDLAMMCAPRALSADEAAQTSKRYIMRHGASCADGQYVALMPKSASLSGQVLEVEDLLTVGEGPLMAYERRAVDHMNDDHVDAVKSYAQTLLGAEAGEWRLASLDMDGLDLVRCDASGIAHRRLWFHPPLADPEAIKSKLVELSAAGRAS